MLTDVAGNVFGQDTPTRDVDAVSFAVLVDISVAYRLDRDKQSDDGI